MPTAAVCRCSERASGRKPARRTGGLFARSGSGASQVASFDVDRDAIGHHGRLMRDMAPVAEHELQRVTSLGKRDGGFGLALAEMDVMFIRRDRLVQRLAFDLRVDDEV